MDNHIQGGLKKERVKILINLGEEKLNEFSKNMLGREAEVLFEREKDGYFHGYTQNYLKVKVKAESDLKNTIHKVRFFRHGLGLWFLSSRSNK
jgi:threonylcarbamoyladenosine tRNA methylthiotransferase MtaB